MLYWFQLNPKVNYCTNTSGVKAPSINTWQDSSVWKAWDCNRRTAKVLGAQVQYLLEVTFLLNLFCSNIILAVLPELSVLGKTCLQKKYLSATAVASWLKFWNMNNYQMSKIISFAFWNLVQNGHVLQIYSIFQIQCSFPSDFVCHLYMHVFLVLHLSLASGNCPQMWCGWRVWFCHGSWKR